MQILPKQIILLFLAITSIRKSNQKSTARGNKGLNLQSAIDCECWERFKVFDILQTIILQSEIQHFLVVSNENRQVCGDLGSIRGILSYHSCSSWEFDPSLFPAMALATIIIDCGDSTTQAIARELLEARSYNGTERRLALPVFNIIFTHDVGPQTQMLDLKAIYFVILRKIATSVIFKSDMVCQRVPDRTCVDSHYDILYQEGYSNIRRVGKYQGAYQGDASFLRNRFSNFEGMDLKVTTALYSPFTLRDNDTYRGFCIDLLDVIAEHLNFTYTMKYSIDGNFGIKNPDGHWNGMVGMLERKEVDLIMAGLTITAMRETVVDFTLPFYEEASAVLVQADIQAKNIPWSYLFDPLQYPVWMVTLFSLVACIAIYHTMEKLAIATKCDPRPFYNTGKDELSKLRETIWLYTVMYLRQGAENMTSLSALRILIGLFWIVPILISWMYGANLTASLATSETSLPFSSLQELVDDTEYIILVESGGVQRLILEHSQMGVYSSLWSKIEGTKPTSLISSTVDAVEKMFKDRRIQKYAVMSDQTYMQSILAQKYSSRCDWAFIPETFFKSGLGIALPEGSPYKEIFDKSVMTALSCGLTVKYRRKNFLRQTCEIVEGTQQEFARLSVGHIRTLLIILGAGILVSTIIFSIEYCTKKKNNKVAFE